MAEPTILEAEVDLATSTTSQLFSGSEHGVESSFFMVHMAPGKGPRLHRHPYPEVFIVQEGEATFRVDDGEHAARAGHVLVVPTGAAHGFVNSGSTTLEVISIHPVAEMETEWLEEEATRTIGG